MIQDLKKFSQSVFKKLFQIIFKLLYGRIIYVSDNLLSNNILINDIKNPNIRTFNDKTYRIYNIKNGRIYSDNVENVAIIDENNIIDNISYQQIQGNLVSANKNICLQKGTPRIKNRFKGRVLSLAQGASGISNYYHWLFDLLPKIKLYSEIYNFNELDYLYAGNLQNFQTETLVPLGLDKIKVIDIANYRHIEADEIICTDHPNYYEGFIENKSKDIPAWTVKWLKDTYLKHAQKFECNDKIFIDRSSSQSKHCQFINYNEILGFLSEMGFSKYKTENLNFFEKIYLFNNANFIIGAHGAGFANLAFCKKGTKVIEIRPKNRTNSLYGRISEINNLDYSLVTTKVIDESEKIYGDIELDLNELKKYF